MRKILLLCVTCLILAGVTLAIQCYVGYGQRGLEYSNEISWKRNCPQSNYCFEAVTYDVKKVQKLINYPWNSYYSQFFVRSCGGDLGTQIEYRPFRGHPRSFRALGNVKINITVDHAITGHGGTEEFMLKHACRKNLCLKGPSANDASRWSKHSMPMLLTTVAITVLSVLFALQ
jgi:hypothetical protein